MAETAQKKVRRVFQCIGKYDEMSSQIVTFNPTMLEIRDKASRAIVIDRTPAGQFVLRADAAKYDEQLAALRRMCERYSWLVEIPVEGEGKPQAGWIGKDRAQEQLIEGVRRSAEQSNIELKLAQSQESNKQLAEENEFLREELETLKKLKK